MSVVRADFHVDAAASEGDGGLPRRAPGEMRSYVKDYKSRFAVEAFSNVQLPR